MDVFLTIDTETYPLTEGWRRDGLRADLDRDVYGCTKSGEFGLDYQLGVLRRHDLRAVFMIESLFASVPEVGPEPLKRIIASVLADGHDVQIHPHPEWVPYVPELAAIKNHGHLINAYPFEFQLEIVRLAVANLIKCGAPAPKAFRAGDFAADLNTLRALRRLGITFDTSYNPVYFPSRCHLDFSPPLTQPRQIEGIWEVPVSFFEDLPGRYRPAQFCACSSDELIHALEQAYATGWKYFVIVSHSFEFLKNRRNGGEVRPRRNALLRFESVCKFLADHRDRFRTARFVDLPLPQAGLPNEFPVLHGSMIRTALRMGEQLLDRVFA